HPHGKTKNGIDFTSFQRPVQSRKVQLGLGRQTSLDFRQRQIEASLFRKNKPPFEKAPENPGVFLLQGAQVLTAPDRFMQDQKSIGEIGPERSQFLMD